MRRGLLVVVAALVTASTLLAGCQSIKVGFVGSSRTGHMSASYQRFTGDESRAVAMKQDQVLHLDYEMRVEQGQLSVGVLAPNGDEVWTGDPAHIDSGSIDLPAEQPGDYRVIAVGKDTKGGFDLSWRVE